VQGISASTLLKITTKLFKITTNNNKWSETFDKRSYHSSWIFHGEQRSVTLTSRQHWSRLQQLPVHAITEDWMIPFAAYTAADSQCFSMGQTTSENSPFPWEILTPT